MGFNSVLKGLNLKIVLFCKDMEEDILL